MYTVHCIFLTRISTFCLDHFITRVISDLFQILYLSGIRLYFEIENGLLFVNGVLVFLTVYLTNLVQLCNFRSLYDMTFCRFLFDMYAYKYCFQLSWAKSVYKGLAIRKYEWTFCQCQN